MSFSTFVTNKLNTTVVSDVEKICPKILIEVATKVAPYAFATALAAHKSIDLKKRHAFMIIAGLISINDTWLKIRACQQRNNLILAHSKETGTLDNIEKEDDDDLASFSMSTSTAEEDDRGYYLDELYTRLENSIHLQLTSCEPIRFEQLYIETLQIPNVYTLRAVNERGFVEIIVAEPIKKYVSKFVAEFINAIADTNPCSVKEVFMVEDEMLHYANSILGFMYSKGGICCDIVRSLTGVVMMTYIENQQFMPNASSLMRELNTVIISMMFCWRNEKWYEYHKDMWQHVSDDAISSAVNKFKAQIFTFIKALVELGPAGFTSAVINSHKLMDLAKRDFCSNKLRKLSLCSPYMITMGNLTMNVLTHEVIFPLYGDHAVADTCANVLNISSENKYYKAHKQYLHQLFPNPQYRKFFCAKLIESLEAGNSAKRTFIAKGGTDRSKSVFFGILKSALQFCMGSIRSLAVSDTSININSGLKPIIECRIATIDDVSDNAYLSGEIIKKVSGGDPMQIRQMRTDTYSSKPTATIFIIHNQFPKFDTLDEALVGRLIFLVFSNQWIDPVTFEKYAGTKRVNVDKSQGFERINMSKVTKNPQASRVWYYKRNVKSVNFLYEKPEAMIRVMLDEIQDFNGKIPSIVEDFKLAFLKQYRGIYSWFIKNYQSESKASTSSLKSIKDPFLKSITDGKRSKRKNKSGYNSWIPIGNVVNRYINSLDTRARNSRNAVNETTVSEIISLIFRDRIGWVAGQKSLLGYFHCQTEI